MRIGLGKEDCLLDSSVWNQKILHSTRTVPELGPQERTRLLDHVGILERAIILSLDDSLYGELQGQAHRRAEELADALETLGLTFAARLARGIECMFKGKMPFEEALILQLAEFVVALRENIGRE